MNVVSLERVVKRHATTVVLDGVTLGIDGGERIGVIGLNGSGKSTLLKLIAGVDTSDDGRVVRGRGLRVGYLPQQPVLDPGATALAAVLSGQTPAVEAARELERAMATVDTAPQDPAVLARLDAATRGADATGAWELDQHAGALLQRLGIDDPSATVRSLSGGQRKRVALARTLLEPAELLILDEPTNHLDVEVIAWLEEELAARSGALVLVTHDRYLLDRVATRIVEVERGHLHTHDGGYEQYLQARAERQEAAAALERRRRNRLRTELAWLRRRPKARTSKAGYRVAQAQTLQAEQAQAARAEASAGRDLDFEIGTRRAGRKVADLEGAGKRFGDCWVLRDVNLRIPSGARVGVVGPNGSGKTTLLNLIAGRLQPDAGQVSRGATVQVGYYGQDPEELPADQRVHDAVAEVAGLRQADGREVTAGGLLERFGFPPEAQRAWVGQLSGGERRRLELLRVLATTPNLLLLDEPTNDLDLDTLGVLEDFLDDWAGTLVTVSHDRYFLDRVCKDLHSLTRAGALRHHPGGWPAYRALVESERRDVGADRRQPASPGAAPRRPSNRPRKRSDRERRELAQLERRVPELERQRERLAEELAQSAQPQAAAADAADPFDYAAIQRLGEELANVQAALDEAETRWLELSLIGEQE